eukprot:9496130-Pyramimonas_sp.AAC.1
MHLALRKTRPCPALLPEVADCPKSTPRDGRGSRPTAGGRRSESPGPTASQSASKTTAGLKPRRELCQGAG